MARANICIVSYNRADLLEKLVTSIFEHTSVEFALFIIDNNSTEKRVIDYLKSLEKNMDYANLFIVLNKENRGYASAVNQAAKLGHSPYILILNNDIRLSFGWDIVSLEFMGSNRDVGVLGYRLVDSRGICKGCGVDSNWKLRGWGMPIDEATEKFNEPEPVKYVGGSAMFTRRDIWEKLGGFNEEYFFYCEDAQYCLDAAKLDFKTYYIPHTITHHHEGSLGTSKESERENRNKHFAKSLEIFHKHYPNEKGYS